jgi:hypothetical protein
VVVSACPTCVLPGTPDPVTRKVANRAPWRPVPLSWPYNEVRPHRGIARRTPASVYKAREKAGPSPSFVKVGDRRLRFDRVDKAGRVTLRYRGRLYHIGVGRA